MKLQKLFDDLKKYCLIAPDMPVCIERRVDKIYYLTISTFQISDHIPEFPNSPFLTTLGIPYPDTTINCLKTAVSLHLNDYSNDDVLVENLVNPNGQQFNPSEILKIDETRFEYLRCIICTSPI